MAKASLLDDRGQQLLDAGDLPGYPGPNRGPLVALSLQEFLRTPLPARERMMSPWLFTRSLSTRFTQCARVYDRLRRECIHRVREYRCDLAQGIGLFEPRQQQTF